MKKNIQAFPQLETGYKGMTLFDYFAGQVLTYHPMNQHNYDAVAQHCYKIAEAMMEEREKRNEGK